MSRLEPLQPSQLGPEARPLYDAITQGPRASGPQHFALTCEDGGSNGPFNAFLLNPGLGQALQGVGAALRYEGTVSARSREVAILTVAAAWDSTFERQAHEAVGRAVGLDGATTPPSPCRCAYSGSDEVRAGADICNGRRTSSTWGAAQADEVGLGPVDGVGRPEVPGLLDLHVADIDEDDRRRAGDLGAHDRGVADTAAGDDGDRVTTAAAARAHGHHEERRTGH